MPNLDHKRKSLLNEQDREFLNKGISWEEVILAVNSLKDYSSPGTDQILNRDLTVLLHQGEDSQPDKDGVNILHFIHGIFNKFWREEQVPPELKCSIIVPFLKDTDNDASLPQNYRPISLLNSLMKTYEQVIKSRLVNILEKNKFFSKIQAAYRKSRSTCDHLLALQEIFLHYRYTKLDPRGGKGKQTLLYALRTSEKH